MIIRIQPSPRVDHITADGTEFTQLPYPFFVDADGLIGRQDVWNGTPLRVVGFQKDLAVQQIDLWWKDAFRAPQKAVGMYLVTEDKDGSMGSHMTAVMSMEALTPVLDGQNRLGSQGA